jgi:tellurite methyltransferase
VTDWSRYYAAAGDDPRPTLLDALERFEGEPGERPRLAVDLGCGTGRDTAELLRRGWRVVAVDSKARALEGLRERTGAADRPRLETLLLPFEEARLPQADLVNASFSLPFCPPPAFGALWARVRASLLPGARFSGQLFGERDDWAGDGLTVHTRREAEELFDGFELERFEEVEEDGRTAVGDAKHWHLFHVVARRR